VPEAMNTPVLYSIAIAREAPQPAAAAAFVALALGEHGQRVLHDAGFLPIGAK
jgi:molybdate transport system substrate-binding protein